MHEPREKCKAAVWKRITPITTSTWHIYCLKNVQKLMPFVILIVLPLYMFHACNKSYLLNPWLVLFFSAEVVSLRWKIILGISAGVILVIICFVLYCCLCRKSKPTIPGDSSRSVNYLPGTTSYHQNTRHKQITSSSNRHHENSHCNQNRHSQPPRYSDIPRNPQLNIPTTGTVQFNPQINVNVTVNGNPGQGDPPPAYTFYSHTG